MGRYLTIIAVILIVLPVAGGQTTNEDIRWQIVGAGTDKESFSKLREVHDFELQQLRLGWPGMSDDTMEGVVEFRKLSHLQISNVSALKQGKVVQIAISSSGWKHLARLPNLRVLRVDDVELSEQSLREIGKLGSLTSLHLGNCKVSNAAVKHLLNCKNLKALSLSGSPITDEAAKSLINLTSIETIDLSQTNITNHSTAYLNSLPKLKTAYLGYTQIDDVGLLTLAKSMTLKYLSVIATRVTEKGRQSLNRISPQIELLDVSGKQ